MPHDAIIRSYSVLLKNDILKNETYIYDDGILNKNYNYDKEDRLISIYYECSYKDDAPQIPPQNQKKRIEYLDND